mgnify:CR=1 FL=1
MRMILFSWIALLPLAGQTLQVTQGAADYQVYQRGPNNAATLKVPRRSQNCVLAPAS